MLMSADGNTFKGAAAQILLFPDLPLDSFLSLVSNIFSSSGRVAFTDHNLHHAILSSLDASVNWVFFFHWLKVFPDDCYAYGQVYIRFHPFTTIFLNFIFRKEEKGRKRGKKKEREPIVN
jgi:hypothetical protein